MQSFEAQPQEPLAKRLHDRIEWALDRLTEIEIEEREIERAKERYSSIRDECRWVLEALEKQ